jgi:hypothetical protein
MQKYLVRFTLICFRILLLQHIPSQNERKLVFHSMRSTVPRLDSNEGRTTLQERKKFAKFFIFLFTKNVRRCIAWSRHAGGLQTGLSLSLSSYLSLSLSLTCTKVSHFSSFCCFIRRIFLSFLSLVNIFFC